MVTSVMVVYAKKCVERTLIVFPMKNASKEFAKQFVILMPLVDLIRYVKIGYVILVVEVITLVRKTKLALIINAKILVKDKISVVLVQTVE